ncbi:Na+/H+ antiporter subunit E [Pseudoalteromonas sp. McH1-42]|uniref:Na+/H+ antiporter subunit E n=1 Tax=Pseudoalteromonas sp. McH1-42 TaxID=2917752 RepID=UPI001EF701AC|nr:Na+/H+ antiporter subunit E [Pseudoalteromonas sp. McH1-42]MCG7561519.1 Na+/H+ antiporter subunit E [Pseudoalteromonas sp. McH1-42]
MNSKTHSYNSDKRTLLIRALIFSALWLLLTKGAWSSWVIGIVVVPVSVWMSMRLFNDTSRNTARSNGKVVTGQFHYVRLLRLLPYFLLNSLKGGIQTARLAFARRVSMQPGTVLYPLRLPPGHAQLWFIHLISLLPGTLSAQLRGDSLLVHMLEVTEGNYKDVIDCEQKIAYLFDLEIDKQAVPVMKEQK